MSGTSAETVTPNPEIPLLTLPWEVPAGSVHEILSYSAPVMCATVAETTLRSRTSSPAARSFADTPVLFTMTDGGSPGAVHDTWRQATNLVGCDLGAGGDPYTIVGGNLVVH
jgi:hypothetical protein